MPATSEDIVAFVERLMGQEVMPYDRPIWQDGSAATDEEMVEVYAVLRYTAYLRHEERVKAKSRPARRRACRTLRAFLHPEQREQWKRSGCFTVTAASGRRFRFYPYVGMVQEIERHGTRDFGRRRFCLHPQGVTLPPADVTLAQLLVLSASEEEFLALANPTELMQSLWNPEYLALMREGPRRVAALEQVAGLLQDVVPDE